MVSRESLAVNCVGFYMAGQCRDQAIEYQWSRVTHCAWMGGLKHHNVHQVFTSTGTIITMINYWTICSSISLYVYDSDYE